MSLPARSDDTVEIPDVFAELFEPHRYKVFWGGRGGAKSWNFARALLIQGAQRPLQILCARELQKSIKESVHYLLKTQIERLGLNGNYEVLNTEIRGINGTRFIFEGIKHNVDKIKSMEAVDICWVEEADCVSDDSWKVLIPTIRKAGSEIWISFNPRNSHDATYQRFIVHAPPDAYVRKVSWRDNPWFSQEMRAEMDHLKQVDLEDYLHVWEGELKVIADGAIYGKQLLKAREDGRICAVPIENSCEVNTFWDLGKNDHTAIWFHQKVGLQNRFIDYYESRLEELDHYIRLLKSKPYNYGTHYLPHDVQARILGMERTRKQQLEDGGVRPVKVVARIADINEGIAMTRAKFPSCWFDEERCKEGVEALSNYVWHYDEDADTHRKTPVHNWASNGADAFRQFAQGYTVANKPVVSMEGYSTEFSR